jgi:hypothetical protein
LVDDLTSLFLDELNGMIVDDSNADRVNTGDCGYSLVFAVRLRGIRRVAGEAFVSPLREFYFLRFSGKPQSGEVFLPDTCEWFRRRHWQRTA